MKIVDMRVTGIAITDPPLRSSYGRHAPYALRAIVELESDDGVVGIAECHGGDQALADFASVRDLVVGADPVALTSIGIAIDDHFQPSTSADRTQTWFVPGENRSDVSPRVFAAIEIAALDLVGKTTGLRVCDLLGGAVRESVTLAAYLFYKHGGGGGDGDDTRADHWGEAFDPGSIVDQAVTMIDRYGYSSVKLKGGVLEPAKEVETMLALRDRLGSAIPLRIDPNAAWSIETALEVGRKLAGVLEYLEDPTPGLEGMAELRSRLLAEGIDTPLASNVAVTNFADVARVSKLDAVQVVLSDHHYWGGARAITHLGTMCHNLGLGLSMHSNTHLGLSLVTMAHVGAATKQLSYDIDTHYPWQHAEDEIISGGRIRISDGELALPGGPGLGVELDYDALARGRERYDASPYRKRDDRAEMRRHVDPNWERKVPAW